ncbi:NAD(P)-binding protein [Mycena leptocephala]|nr:NAD(P)-binding protein [Mycena leptocephala]
MPTLEAVRASNAAWDPSQYTPVGSLSTAPPAEAFTRNTKGNAYALISSNRPAATAILAHIDKPPVPGPTREFLPCDLALIANAKRIAAALRARFPHINILFLSAGAVSLKGLDIGEEGVDRQMAALYYSKWVFIDGLLPALRAAHEAGEGARVAALHTAGRGGPVDLDDLGLIKGIRRSCPQLASYQDLMAEASPRTTQTPVSRYLIHTCLPGHGRHPLLRASPSAILRAMHYLRFLLFPTLMFHAMSISECGQYQLYGLLQAPPGTSRTGGTGEDIGLGGVGDPTWDEARAALGRHSEGVVGGVEV